MSDRFLLTMLALMCGVTLLAFALVGDFSPVDDVRTDDCGTMTC